MKTDETTDETAGTEQSPETTTAVATEAASNGKPKAAAKKIAAKKPAADKKPNKADYAEVAKIYQLPIADIAGYDNPRHEPEYLYELGYDLFGKDNGVKEPTETERVSLVHLALSKDLDDVRRYVDLIETHEGMTMKLFNSDGKTIFVGTEVQCRLKIKETGEKGCKIEEHDYAPDSIVQLAEDIFLFDQFVPVEMRGKSVMVDGGRRVAAILYLHAKSRVCKHDKVGAEIFGDKDTVPKEYPAIINATDLKSSANTFLAACKINLSRKNFSPLQEGRVYHEMLARENPDTKKAYTKKEAALAVAVPYNTFRNREALWHDRAEKDGKKYGLTSEDRRRLALGEITLTAASRKALGEQHYSETGERQNNRAKAIPLAEMQKLFDATPDKNEVRRQAIADCMGIKLTQAIKESDARIEKQDEISMKKTSSKKGKKAA